MSTRGANFLDRWMAEHLPEVVTDDTAAISDLTDQVMEAADREGIEVSEIYEEVGSVFEAIAVAMQHRDGSLPDNDFNEFDLLAGRLSREANLTEAQARDLIERFGTDWEKLLNEAHFLKELEGRLGNKSLIGAATLCRNEDPMGKEYPFSESTLGDKLAAGTALSVHCFGCQRRAVLDVAELVKRFGPDQPCLHWDLLKIIYCHECRAAGRDDRDLQFTNHAVTPEQGRRNPSV